MSKFAIAGIQMHVTTQNNIAEMRKRLALLMHLYPWVEMVCFSELAAHGPALPSAQAAGGDFDQAFADMARQHTDVFLQVISGSGFAQPNPRPMFPNPPGMLPIEPQSPGLRDRIWWGAGSRATAEWTAQQGMNLMSSTLLTEDTGVPFHQLQAEQIERFRKAWTDAGHTREPRVSVSRSIFAIVDDRDRAYFGRGGSDSDQVGVIDNAVARFGRSYADEPDKLIDQLREDEAIAAADTLLLTVPNQLGVDYNAHVLEAILTHVAPALGWR